MNIKIFFVLLKKTRSIFDENTDQFYVKKFYLTTAHPQCNGHSISTSICGVWGRGGKGWSSSLQEGVSHTYTLKLSHSRILACIKKKIISKKFKSVFGLEKSELKDHISFWFRKKSNLKDQISFWFLNKSLIEISRL